MKRPLTRNRRIAVVCASCATVAATSPVLLGLTTAHSGISDMARGIGAGLSLGVASALLVISFGLLKRDRTACSSKKA